MKTIPRLLILIGLSALAAVQANAQNKKKPLQAAYLGYVYPAGGQQGTTFSVRIGGQRLEGASEAIVSGDGVRAVVKNCFEKINTQDMRLLKEQLQLFKKGQGKKQQAAEQELSEDDLIVQKNIEERVREYERNPANESLSTVVELEITVDPRAEPGPREIRLLTNKGLSNPLPFHVGTLPESTRTAMRISKFQILGKEGLALRKRPPEEEEAAITLPCTANGQIASGEVNRYRFTAQQGQKLVITTLARQLIPYIADAVPGWFQPIISLQDADGTEVAWNDDHYFNPDPTILFEVPQNGEYVLTIQDAIYRGREDFVYRITMGEIPFITSIFPAGDRSDSPTAATIEGWNLENAKLDLPNSNAEPGLYSITARTKDAISNPIPFMMDTLPEELENDAKNNSLLIAQKVRAPVIINGRINRPGDQDFFTFTGKEGQRIVAEVYARRLDSPLDSLLTLTDANGNILALNDDHADPGSGLNTHHADSYIITTLPADGDYTLQLTDTARQGGHAYTYRLRISKPRPDFALRTMPSHITIRNGTGTVEIFAIRRDGYDGPIELTIDTPGFQNTPPVTLPDGEERIQFPVIFDKKKLSEPVAINIIGTGSYGQPLVHRAVPAEDWMQAFLWRHLVPAKELLACSLTAQQESPAQRPQPEGIDISAFMPSNNAKLTEEQKSVAWRVRRVHALYNEWLLGEDLYAQTMTGLLEYKEPEKAKPK
jgi:hypothetical protein